MKLLANQPRLPSWRANNVRCQYKRTATRPFWDTSTPHDACRWAARFEHDDVKLCVHHAKHVALLVLLKGEAENA